MRRRGLVIAALPLALSCHEHQMDPKSAPPSRPADSAPAPPRAALPEWVPAVSTHASTSFPPTPDSGDGGTLVQGQRVGHSGATSSQLTMPNLVGGSRVPAHLGGGFLFWSANALFFARTFVGELEPLVAVEAQVDHVSFGTGYAIVHLRNGVRFARSWPAKAAMPLPVAGLIDAASLPDGRAVLLVEPDLVLTLGAGQKTWRDMTTSAPGAIQLRRTHDALWLETGGRGGLRVEQDGSLSSHAALPRDVLQPATKEPDPRWPTSVREAPLTRAVKRGIPLDEHTALVEVAGAFARVDLPSGELTSVTPAALAGARDCALLPVEGDVLAVCTATGAAVVLSGAAGAAPKIERSFPASGRFFAGSVGTLLFAGPCEAQRATGTVVCVRQRDGSWKELGAPARPAAGPDAGAARPLSVSRWVPTRDGGAIGLVAGAQGGFYNPATGELQPFSSDEHVRHSGLFTSPARALSDEFAQAADGRIVAYVGRKGLVLHADGRVQETPHIFQSLASSGALALASDGENRLWQSNDYGQRWVEIARPPGTNLRPGVAPEVCSRVGCAVPGWYRLGYRSSTPSPTRLTTIAQPPLPPRAPAPRLVCERTAAPRTRWVTRALDTQGAQIEAFGFGARKVGGRPDELATISLALAGTGSPLLGATLVEVTLNDSSAPGFAGSVARNRVLAFTDLLSEPKLHETRFSWQEVITRQLETTGERLPGINEDTFESVPVLTEKGSGSAGLLVPMASGVVLWARPGQAARVLSLGRENDGFEPRSALSRGKDELLVLVSDATCAARVLALMPSGARTLLELPRRASSLPCPANPDALGVADDGSLAVLRLPSAEVPSADDPALALRPGQKPVTLAAWTSLAACGADTGGLRAWVVTQRPWLELRAPGLAKANTEHVFALVRWSESRICAELVGVGAAPVAIGDQELDTTVIARFGTGARADRRGFALGAEHAEDMSCKLAAP